MLRYVASFFSSNTKTNEPDISDDIVYVTQTEEVINPEEEEEEEEVEEEEGVTPFIQLHTLRQRKQQELEQQVLLRRIARQSVMNRYAQDHLPLSQIQENLEEDNLPLGVIKNKLIQRKDDLSVYTTTKENINILLYNKPSNRVKSKKNRPTLSTLITAKIDNNISSNSDSDSNSNMNSNTSNIDDDKNYDVWDDAIIGRLMNLIDDMDEEDEIILKSKNETIKEVTKEKSSSDKNKSFVGSTGSTMIEKIEKENDIIDTIEKKDKIKVTESSSAATAAAADDSVENIQENIQEGTSLNIDKEMINFSDTINVADSLATAITPPIVDKRSMNPKPDSGYGENSIFNNNNNNTRGSKFFGKRRSTFSSSDSQNSVSQTNDNNLSESLQRELSRRSSIHSKRSYRSSLSSKFSTTSVITEIQNDDDYDNIKFRNKFFTNPRSSVQKSNKSLRFLRNLWKSNQDNLPNKEIMEQRNGQNLSNHGEHGGHVGIERSASNETIGSVSDRSGPDYSNFYLAMPNGKWMVRTRTGSRKITGTQYVDKEHI